MIVADARRMQAMITFSKSCNISSPVSNDIATWWQNAVNEMKEKDIHFFYLALKGALVNNLGNSTLVFIMFRELEKRKLELHANLKLT